MNDDKLENQINQIHEALTGLPLEDRVNVQAIGAYIKGEGELTSLDRRELAQRMEEAGNLIEQFLEDKKHGLSKESKAELEDLISHYTLLISGVHYSLGIKTGAQIIVKLLDRSNRDD